jgi:hypothetical protein
MAGTVSKLKTKQPSHVPVGQMGTAPPRVGEVETFGGVVHRLTQSPNGKVLAWVPIAMEAS